MLEQVKTILSSVGITETTSFDGLPTVSFQIVNKNLAEVPAVFVTEITDDDTFRAALLALGAKFDVLVPDKQTIIVTGV